ncbi:hypothetical protein ZEAMMB73_Zm00001d050602 [Zea mays]|uniref:Uncharacterized protein n=1 Tax=Zea mays TaxID=4577 RepID=A0A1D6Q2F5_MAIZE|nr:hypothetical protein ZEAMMB73_Zm00001d050602 [Zea mays]
MRSSRRCAACGGFLQGGEHGGGARSSRGTGQEHWRGEEIEEALCFLGVPRQHLGAVTCLSIITIFIIPHKISPVSNLSMFDYNDYHRTIDCILQIAVKKLNPESVQGLQEWQDNMENFNPFGHHRMFWALQYSCTNRGNPIAPVIKLVVV